MSEENKNEEIMEEGNLDTIFEDAEIAREVIEAEEAIANNKELIKEDEIKVEGKIFYYTKVILSGLLDQIFAMGAALILFTVYDLILGLFGYTVKDASRETVFLIVYIITNVLYYPLVQEILHGKTLGKKIMVR